MFNSYTSFIKISYLELFITFALCTTFCCIFRVINRVVIKLKYVIIFLNINRVVMKGEGPTTENGFRYGGRSV